jgi:hypothetical protein
MEVRMRNPLPRGGLWAVVLALALGCQAGDGVPTEVDRSIETQGFLFTPEATEIFAAIDDVLPRRQALDAARQFTSIAILMPRRPAHAQRKAADLIDYLFSQYARNRVQGPEPDETFGALILAITEFVGLSAGSGIEGSPAAACTPGVDCELAATVDDELAVVEIPGDAITQPFVIYMIRLPDDFADPPLFPLFYEIGTIPAGITFPGSSPSGSLTLSAGDDAPVAAVCALDEEDPLGTPADAVPGQNLFLAHQENGVWETLPYVPLAALDCESASSGIGESASLWSSPIRLAAGPVLDALSPGRLRAKGRGLGGAISSFSPFGAIYTGPVPTETTLGIVGGGTSFTAGETIAFRATVSPAPDDAANGRVLFLATDPVRGPGAPVERLVNGAAVQPFVCGSSRIPFGSHVARVQFLGTAGHAGSASPTLAYDCHPGSGGN